MTGQPGKRRALLALLLFGTVLFSALGVWQVERLAWKRALIARVDARIHAPPEPAPDAARWQALGPRGAEYRRVVARGVFLHDRETLVDALTERGAGWWVVTPLRVGDGVILVNRGFVPRARRDPATRAAGQLRGEVCVVGLLRLSEPGGRILRPNDPAHDRWFSRDLAAIALARGLRPVAPYFIDAQASPAGGLPEGGLTVVHFRNAHLAYALTWFALAALCGAGLVLVAREKGARNEAGRADADR